MDRKDLARMPKASLAGITLQVDRPQSFCYYTNMTNTHPGHTMKEDSTVANTAIAAELDRRQHHMNTFGMPKVDLDHLVGMHSSPAQLAASMMSDIHELLKFPATQIRDIRIGQLLNCAKYAMFEDMARTGR